MATLAAEIEDPEKLDMDWDSGFEYKLACFILLKRIRLAVQRPMKRVSLIREQSKEVIFEDVLLGPSLVTEGCE